MRRTPEAILLSARILTTPIWPVRSRCVPPQSSRLNPSTAMTRTVSWYFSPNRAMAPLATASSMAITLVRTGRSRQICSLASASMAASSLGLTAV